MIDFRLEELNPVASPSQIQPPGVTAWRLIWFRRWLAYAKTAKGLVLDYLSRHSKQKKGIYYEK